MKQKTIVRIAVFIFIATLLLLSSHSLFRGLEKDHGHCLLCDLLISGFPNIKQYQILVLFLFITVIIYNKSGVLSLLSCLQIHLRAPPYDSNL
jgi:hypothetical protein